MAKYFSTADEAVSVYCQYYFHNNTCYFVRNAQLINYHRRISATPTWLVRKMIRRRVSSLRRGSNLIRLRLTLDKIT